MTCRVAGEAVRPCRPARAPMRSRGAMVLVLAAVSVGACAASGQGDGTEIAPPDASTGAEADVANGPSPDAVVLGVDAGDEPGDASAGDDAASDVDAGNASKSCGGLPDGTLCGSAPDVCHDAPVCAGGVCAPAAAKADGFVCAAASDACHTPGTCKAGVCGTVGTRADGYNWDTTDDTARCCGGKPIHTNVDSDCGACGIACNPSNGESCQTLGGHWFCRGCIASAACWSHCCSTSFTPYSCAASDCAGNCSDQYCPPGTHCVAGNGVSSDYCSY